MENSDKPKTRKRQPRTKAKEPAVRFRSDNPQHTPEHTNAELADDLRQMLYQREFIEKQQKALHKSMAPTTINRALRGKVTKNKIVFSAQDQNFANGIEEKAWKRVSDRENRDIALLDPYISSIISTRTSQGAIIGRPSDSKFDKGTRVAEINPLSIDDFGSEEEFVREQRVRQEEMKAILQWFQACGTKDIETLNEIYRGEDNTFKFCSMSEFISSQVRNLLTFGRMGTHFMRDESGLIVAFRPAPIETIKNVKDGEVVHMSHTEETSEESTRDNEEYNQLPEDERPIAYVQRVDGQLVNFFTEYDLRIDNLQKQALFDLDGYPLSPIEQAIFMVYVHQQSLGYIKNYFVKGIGSKSMLVIKSQDPSTALSNEDLDNLRRQFHNYVSRNDNSATTPVISGPVDVEVIPLSPNPKDMEFVTLEDHIVRALCSAFQISPQEMGYGHLSAGEGGLNQSNKQEEIIRGEERGLRVVLDVIYDALNAILYEHFPEAEKKYRITYTGVGEDTRDAVIQRNIAELNTTATMSSLYADSEKTEPIRFGGDVPLAAAFHANVVKYMKYGDFMEAFFGKKGWSTKPEYDFIIDPNLNAAYMQLKINPIQMQQEQTQLQLQMQEQGMEQQQQMAQMQMQQAQNPQQMPPDMPQQPDQAPQEDAQKSESVADAMMKKSGDGFISLRDAIAEKEKLNKSVSSYFAAWVDANTKD